MQMEYQEHSFPSLYPERPVAMLNDAVIGKGLVPSLREIGQLYVPPQAKAGSQSIKIVASSLFLQVNQTRFPAPQSSDWGPGFKLVLRVEINHSVSTVTIRIQVERISSRAAYAHDVSALPTLCSFEARVLRL